MAKIVMIGVGRVVFTRQLPQDVGRTPALHEAHGPLVDIDAGRRERVAAFARRLATDTEPSLTIEMATCTGLGRCQEQTAWAPVSGLEMTWPWRYRLREPASSREITSYPWEMVLFRIGSIISNWKSAGKVTPS